MDYDKLIERLKSAAGGPEGIKMCHDAALAIETLRADVDPVRHGRWTPADQTGDCCYTCSECGFERDAYLLDARNYCPNCGARMGEIIGGAE